MEFLVLGPVEIRDGADPLDLGGPRPVAIVAALLAQGREPISQDRLVEALWPDSHRARETFHSHVSRIRRRLGPTGRDVLSRTGAGYTMVTGGRTDVELFDERMAASRAHVAAGDLKEGRRTIEQALDLWRGPAFSGNEHDELVAPEARRLEERRLAALELGFEIALGLGEHQSVVGEVERLSNDHPLRERLWELRMEALVGAGRQAEALRAYQEARRLLAEELGIEPSAPLRRLEQRVLDQDPALGSYASTIPGRLVGLPASPVSLVGREPEVAATSQMLGEVRLVTLLGFGGVGKTTLAIEVGRRAASQFTGGVWMVDLSVLVDPAEVTTEIATAAASARASSGRSLIIVDNCEHLIDSAAIAIADALSLDTELVVLGTSREPLRVAGEHRLPVLPFRVPGASASVEEFSDSAAVRLFVERAAAVRPGPIEGDDLAVVAQICRIAEGIPLAIELAAARTATMSLADVRAGLSARFELLAEGYRTAPVRHRSLEKTLEWSFGLLDDDERWLLAGLRTMLIPFPAKAAEVIFASESRSGLGVLDVLRRLVDRSLVLVDHSTGTAMYSLMESVRGFVYDRSGFQNDFDRRSFVLDLAQHTPVDDRGPQIEMWSALLDGRIDIAQRALDLAYELHDVEAGSFLAGYVAARTTGSGTVGFLGGVRWPYLERFERGFRAGVVHASPTVQALVDYVSVAPDFSGFGTRAAAASHKATALFERGVDVLYHGAGPFGGRAILGAARSWHEATGRSVWIIGVDHDERVTGEPPLQRYVLTSMRRCIPAAAYRELKAAVAAGVDRPPALDLSNRGIMLSTTGGEIDHLASDLEAIRAALIGGDIVVT